MSFYFCFVLEYSFWLLNSSVCYDITLFLVFSSFTFMIFVLKRPNRTTETTEKQISVCLVH